MKFLGFLITTTFISISCSESKLKLAPVVTSCSLLLPVDNYSQTVFFDLDVHAHPELKTCILQDSLAKQSVIIINTDADMRRNFTRNIIMTKYNPNVIIATRFLTPKVIDSLFFIRSNWSLLYIVVTDENKFKCENGAITPGAFISLDNIMNTLWHKLQIMRVGVVFPFACKHKMVIYNGKRPSTRVLYDRSIKLINATNRDELYIAIKKSGEKLAHDYPILAGIFYRFPTSIKDCENLHYYVHSKLNLTLGFCGLDGMVMHDIFSYSKFNVSFCQDKKCNSYGYESHGNVSGALGCIIHNKMDVSFNSRFIALYANDQVDFLHFVTTDTLCVLLRKPDIVPLWHGVFNLFSPSLWALIGAVSVAIGGVMWTTATINKTMTGAKKLTFWGYLHNSVITTFLGCSPMKARTLLMIRTTCLLGSVFFLAIYQGHISRVYTTVERFHTIKTLKELYRSDVSLYTSPSIKNKYMKSLQEPEDKMQEKFFERANLTVVDHYGVFLTDPRDIATIERKSDAQTKILKQYSDECGSPLIDIVDECLDNDYLSYIARSGFPFVEDIRKITERLNEAGLPNIYYKWTQQMLGIRNWISENNSERRAFSKITLHDQCVAFGILSLGMVVSVIVFAAEVRIGRRQHLNLYKQRS